MRVMGLLSEELLKGSKNTDNNKSPAYTFVNQEGCLVSVTTLSDERANPRHARGGMGEGERERDRGRRVERERVRE